jgi:hypothetical protein
MGGRAPALARVECLPSSVRNVFAHTILQRCWNAFLVMQDFRRSGSSAGD